MSDSSYDIINVNINVLLHIKKSRSNAKAEFIAECTIPEIVNRILTTNKFRTYDHGYSSINFENQEDVLAGVYKNYVL